MNETDPTANSRIAGFLLTLALFAVDAAWILALFALPAVWIFKRIEFTLGPLHITSNWGWKPVLIAVLLPFASLGLRLAARHFLKIAAGGLWAANWYRRLALALASIIIFFAAVESILTAFNFKYELPAIIFQGKKEFGGIEVTHTVPDTEILYRFIPGDFFQGRQINKLGYRDREVAAVKKEGAIRVICLGDSVTAQGLPGYSQYLNDLLNAEPPTAQSWEAFNVGVHGYSLRQGLIQFRRDIRPLKPDLVTVYFGWNEHWLEVQCDADLMALWTHPILGKMVDQLRDRKFFMALHWLTSPVKRQKPDENKRYLRVPPDEYEFLMKQLVAEIRAAGAVPVLITAACRPLTDATVGQERIRSKAQGDAVHRQYIEITRNVAKKTGAPLFDLAEIFKGPECDRYFSADGIHYDKFAAEGIISRMLPPEAQPGLRQIAVELHKFLKNLVTTPEWMKRKQ